MEARLAKLKERMKKLKGGGLFGAFHDMKVGELWDMVKDDPELRQVGEKLAELVKDTIPDDDDEVKHEPRQRLSPSQSQARRPPPPEQEQRPRLHPSQSQARRPPPPEQDPESEDEKEDRLAPSQTRGRKPPEPEHVITEEQKREMEKAQVLRPRPKFKTESELIDYLFSQSKLTTPAPIDLDVKAERRRKKFPIDVFTFSDALISKPKGSLRDVINAYAKFEFESNNRDFKTGKMLIKKDSPRYKEGVKDLQNKYWSSRLDILNEYVIKRAGQAVGGF